MPEPQIKTRAVWPGDEAGWNVNPVASFRTETSWLVRSVVSSTPRVRTELASHDIAKAAHNTNPTRSQRRKVQLLAPTLSDRGLIEVGVIADEGDPLLFAQLGHGLAALSPERQIELIEEVGDGCGFSSGEFGQPETDAASFDGLVFLAGPPRRSPGQDCWRRCDQSGRPDSRRALPTTRGHTGCADVLTHSSRTGIRASRRSCVGASNTGAAKRRSGQASSASTPCCAAPCSGQGRDTNVSDYDSSHVSACISSVNTPISSGLTALGSSDRASSIVER